MRLFFDLWICFWARFTRAVKSETVLKTEHDVSKGLLMLFFFKALNEAISHFPFLARAVQASRVMHDTMDALLGGI